MLTIALVPVEIKVDNVKDIIPKADGLFDLITEENTYRISKDEARKVANAMITHWSYVVHDMDLP